MSSRTASVTPLALLLAALLAACSLDTAAAVPPILPGVGGGVDHLPDSGAATADASSAMEEDSAAEPPPTVLDDDALFALRTLADQPLPDVVRIDRTTGRTEVLFRSGPEASSGASIAVDETSVYVPTITHATPSHDQHAILVIDRVTGVVA